MLFTQRLLHLCLSVQQQGCGPYSSSDLDQPDARTASQCSAPTCTIASNAQIHGSPQWRKTTETQDLLVHNSERSRQSTCALHLSLCALRVKWFFGDHPSRANIADLPRSPSQANIADLPRGDKDGLSAEEKNSSTTSAPFGPPPACAHMFLSDVACRVRSSASYLM
jgi:hypothetical protein